MSQAHATATRTAQPVGGPPCRRAFSLLELIVALVIVSMMAALAAPTLLRAGGASAERRALAQLVDALRAARTDAIAARAPVVARMTPAQGALLVEMGAKTLRIDPWPIDRLSDDGDVAEASAEQASAQSAEAAVRFEPSGRTGARGLIARASRSGRLWRIAFDAVSGAPALAPASGEESP